MTLVITDVERRNIGVHELSRATRQPDWRAMRITTNAVPRHGGYDYCKDYGVRLMCDANITQTWEGASRIDRQLIGRSFVKK